MRKLTLFLASFLLAFVVFGQIMVQKPNLQVPQQHNLNTTPMDFDEITQNLLNNA